jgi:hypothetical protein
MKSKPHSHPDHKGGNIRIFTVGLRQIRRFAEFTIPGYTDLGRKFPADFITQPKSQFDVVEALADTIFFDLL